eukprot:2794437-Alexandrium_andersonii.AAC.1
MQGSARDDTMQCDTHVDSMKSDNATYGQGSVQGSRQGSVRADIYVDSVEGDAVFEQGSVQDPMQDDTVQSDAH